MATDSDFSSGNQIPDSEISASKPVDDILMAKIKARDIELLGRMNPFGGPSAVDAGSAIGHGGNITISANTTLGGVHYYTNFTITGGVTVTSSGPLIIYASESINIQGEINATGQGAPAPDMHVVTNPENGISATGGGSVDYAGGGIIYGNYSIIPEGTSPITEGVSAASNAGLLAAILADPLSAVKHKGGAAGAGNLYVIYAAGSAGGGIIILISPIVNLAGGSLLAKGVSGNAGGGAGTGGGGGGLIYIATKAYTAPTTLSVAGGTGGTGSAFNGGKGGDGIIQINVYS